MLKEFRDSYKIDHMDKVEEDELLEVASAPPIVKLINSIIQQAVDMRASDIHIEPYAKDIV